MDLWWEEDAAEWDTSECQVSRPVHGVSSAVRYGVLWHLILSPLSFFFHPSSFKRNKNKTEKRLHWLLDIIISSCAFIVCCGKWCNLVSWTWMNHFLIGQLSEKCPLKMLWNKRLKVRLSPQTWHALRSELLLGVATNQTAPVHLRQITCLCKFLQWRHIREEIIIQNRGQEVKVRETSAVDKDRDPSACW